MANQPAQPQAIDGVSAPTGGFQQGGWYQGRQFWNGSLSAKGVINSQSDQVGAGQKVSDEVNQQSSALQTPGDPQGVAKYLAGFQSAVKGKLPAKIDTTGGSSSELAGAVNSVTSGISGAPTPPDSMSTYDALTGKFNVTGLNQTISDLTNKKNAIITQTQTAANQTENTPGVTADVVSGRESEQQRQAQIQTEALDMQIQTASMQLNNANTAINMMMQFQQTDYQNARQSYEDSFNQAMQIQDLRLKQAQVSQSAKDTAFSENIQTQQLKLDQNKQQWASWQATASIFQTQDSSTFNMTDEQKSQLDAMDTSVGLPAGTLRAIKNTNISTDSQFDPVTGTTTVFNKVTGQITGQVKTGNQPVTIGAGANAQQYTFNSSTGKLDPLTNNGFLGIPLFNHSLDFNGNSVDTSTTSTQENSSQATLVNPKTGEIIQYSGPNDPDYLMDWKSGSRPQNWTP